MNITSREDASKITRQKKTGRCSRAVKRNLPSWLKEGRSEMNYDPQGKSDPVLKVHFIPLNGI